jgi:elongation factor P
MMQIGSKFFFLEANMINSSEMKRGMILDIDGAPWQIIDCSFQTPSARGASTLTKVKIKNLVTGNVLSKSYRGGEMIASADCEKRSVQFLYKDGQDFVFMDNESYDQFNLTTETLGDSAGYMLEGLEVKSMLYNGNVINVELPNSIDLEITDTAPALKNATAQAQLKTAILETGLEILVPPYLTTGEKIRVDTREGRFVSRVND